MQILHCVSPTLWSVTKGEPIAPNRDRCRYRYRTAVHQSIRHPAYQSLRYKELFPYFCEKISLDEAISNLKKSTRNYAKRQLTWFRRDERINWLFADEMTKTELENRSISICENFYNRCV